MDREGKWTSISTNLKLQNYNILVKTVNVNLDAVGEQKWIFHES